MARKFACQRWSFEASRRLWSMEVSWCLLCRFSMDPRNMRVALSTDGFEPFRHGTNQNIWPITLSYIIIHCGCPWSLLHHALIDSCPTSSMTTSTGTCIHRSMIWKNCELKVLTRKMLNWHHFVYAWIIIMDHPWLFCIRNVV